MTGIDLEALEKALAPKGRRPRQEKLPLKPGLSKQDLLAEAKRLAAEYEFVCNRRLMSRYAGRCYDCHHHGLYRDKRYVVDIEEVPNIVLERLVVHGKRKLKDYHDMVNTVMVHNPELALEAGLEGKAGRDILAFIYHRRVKELCDSIYERVYSPKVELYLKFKVAMALERGDSFDVEISGWTTSRRISLSGVDAQPTNMVEMRKLIHFVLHIQEVIDSVNHDLNLIKITEEVKV